MRIALLSADYWPNVGGVAAHVGELAQALVAQGHAVHVLTRPIGSQTAAQSECAGVRIHRPSLTQLRPFCHYALHRWLRGFLRATGIDVLHVHGLRPLPATRALDVPVVFTNHTSGFLKRMTRGTLARRRVARWLDHTQLVLSPSEELAEATLSLDGPTPVRYVPNGVDPGRFSPGPSPWRRKLRIAPEETVVLLARRLVQKNGVCVFAEAVGLFSRPGVRVIFAGDGPERGQVESILQASGMLDRVIFLGNVPNTDMPEIYRAADISVLPSFLEATSITGLESMATGLPLVGTRVGGIPALIDDERTGLLVEPGRPMELAARIARLIDDRGLRSRLGAAARERVLAEFSWSVIAQRTTEFYERLLQLGGRSATAARTSGGTIAGASPEPCVVRRAA